MNKVTLFGEEITLVRPTGRKGVMYMQQALKVWQRMLKAIEPAQGKLTPGKEMSLADAGEVASLVSDYIDDDFLDSVLPGLFQYSDQKLTLKQAQDKIDKWEITLEGLAELFQGFMNAMAFWSQPEDQEALDEAVKKSPDAEAEVEAKEEKGKTEKT